MVQYTVQNNYISIQNFGYKSEKTLQQDSRWKFLKLLKHYCIL